MVTATTVISAITTNESFGWSSTSSRLTSAATMTVMLEAILTAALARLRRSGAMKSGTSASPIGLKEFDTSAKATMTTISSGSEVSTSGSRMKSSAAIGIPTAR